MAATRGMIQHRVRFAIPFRQRVGHPANVVKVAVNVQRTLGSENIANDGDFVGAHCSSEHCANAAADNPTYPHSDSFPVNGTFKHCATFSFIEEIDCGPTTNPRLRV